MMNNMTEKEKLAYAIAYVAHKGQVDKAGKDYILHPLRVSSMCETTDEKIVAILHDTIEDTFVSRKFLEHSGFPNYLIDAIESVTRMPNEDYRTFIKRCSMNKIGRVVKMNDLRDNMDLTRLSVIKENDIIRLKKYYYAYKYLESFSLK